MDIEKNKLKENVASLFVLKAASYIFPLVTLPYLVRVLGPEKFGAIAFAQAFMQYFMVVTDYGFDLTATQKIAVNRNEQDKLSEIFWSVMCVKLSLTALCFILVIPLIYYIPAFAAERQLFLVAYLTVAGNALFPFWYLRGLEISRLAAYVDIAARILTTVAIFVLVVSESDYILAASIQASGMILASVFAFVVIARVIPVAFRLPHWSEIHEQLRSGWHVFASTAAITLYTSSNVFLLGLMTNSVVVGYFSAAEKIIQAAKGVLGPISQGLFPHINNLARSSTEAAMELIGRSMKWLGLAALMLSVALLLLADPIVRILLGDRFMSAVSLVRWMAFIPFFVAISNVLGIQTMLTFGYTREFSRTILGAGVFNIALIIPMIHAFEAVGVAITVATTEALVAVTMFSVLKRRGIQISVHG